jgi:hypothetical protein
MVEPASHEPGYFCLPTGGTGQSRFSTSSGIHFRALLIGLLFSACNVYDPGRLDDAVEDAGPSNGPVGVSGSSGGGGGGGTGGSADPATDSGIEPGPCEPGDGGACEWICPEVCDDTDNDCDGETDESSQ